VEVGLFDLVLVHFDDFSVVGDEAVDLSFDVGGLCVDGGAKARL
jgi:hypothetical protein